MQCCNYPFDEDKLKIKIEKETSGYTGIGITGSKIKVTLLYDKRIISEDEVSL